MAYYCILMVILGLTLTTSATQHVTDDARVFEEQPAATFMANILKLHSIKNSTVDFKPNVTQCSLFENETLFTVTNCILFTAKPIDREKICPDVSRVPSIMPKCRHIVNILVSTADDRNVTVIVELYVTIENVNDNAPYFGIGPTHTINLSPGFPSWYPLISGFEAHDLDGDSSNYRLEGGDRIFYIEGLPTPFNPYHAVNYDHRNQVMLKSNGGYSKPRYELLIKAVDTGTPPLTGTLTVIVNVRT